MMTGMVTVIGLSQVLKALMSSVTERSGNDCKKEEYKVILSNGICFKILGAL